MSGNKYKPQSKLKLYDRVRIKTDSPLFTKNEMVDSIDEKKGTYTTLWDDKPRQLSHLRGGRSGWETTDRPKKEKQSGAWGPRTPTHMLRTGGKLSFKDKMIGTAYLVAGALIYAATYAAKQRGY